MHVLDVTSSVSGSSKMHHNRWRLRLRPHWGAYSAPQTPYMGLRGPTSKGPTSKGRGDEEVDGEERRGEGAPK